MTATWKTTTDFGELAKHRVTFFCGEKGRPDTCLWETLVLTPTPELFDRTYIPVRLFKGKAVMYRAVYSKAETFRTLAVAVRGLAEAHATGRTGREIREVEI